MAIKRSRSGSKVSSSFSSSSMTDLIFLLLVFFILATIFVNQTPLVKVLQVTLPTSDTNKESDNSSAAINILGESGNYHYVLNGEIECKTIDELLAALDKLYVSTDTANKESKVMHVSLHCDRDNTTVQGFVDVATMIQDMNVKYREESQGTEDKYKLVLATKESE